MMAERRAEPTVALRAEHWGGSTAVAWAGHSDVQRAALRAAPKVGQTADPWVDRWVVLKAAWRALQTAVMTADWKADPKDD